MTATRQETLRSEVDALREENEQLKGLVEESQNEVQRLEEKLRQHEQERELVCFRAVQDERRRGEEREARLLALLERQVSVERSRGPSAASLDKSEESDARPHGADSRAPTSDGSTGDYRQ